jgi:outer membrane biosynthesis protein TonB
MARKKPARKKKAVSKKKPARKKIAKIAKTKKKRLAAKKKAVARKKPAKKVAAKKKSAKKKSTSAARSGRGRREVTSPIPITSRRGLGAASGGQSGDTQGLSRREFDDSESVEELMEEGQYMEAEALSGVENARDADQGEVRTRQFPEDDVPEEYQERDD